MFRLLLYGIHFWDIIILVRIIQVSNFDCLGVGFQRQRTRDVLDVAPVVLLFSELDGILQYACLLPYNFGLQHPDEHVIGSHRLQKRQ